ncbi:hypothetical protein SAMN05421787_107115 [Virgibacillus pantothenticus]|nr:hypothetical protein SAMN05421787_107115 [Virgibacillus pantothenticus]
MESNESQIIDNDGGGKPLKPCMEIYQLMKGFSEKWFIAGGWAIDLHIGNETRLHSDIEIAIFRKDQLTLKTYLQGWAFKKVVHGEFQTWENEYLKLPIHEIHAQLNNWELEVLLNEMCWGKWLFRRDSRIFLPINEVYNYSKTGIPYLNPFVVLLFKLKNTRQKDHQDFINVKPFLAYEEKKWLKEAILVHAPTHQWLGYLDN